MNLTAPYLYSIRALPALREAGGGSIVHVSSDAGVWGEEEIGAYSVSKAALITLTQMLAMDAGRRASASTPCVRATPSPEWRP